MSEHLPEILAHNYLVDISKGQVKIIKETNTAGKKHWGFFLTQIIRSR